MTCKYHATSLYYGNATVLLIKYKVSLQSLHFYSSKQLYVWTHLQMQYLSVYAELFSTKITMVLQCFLHAILMFFGHVLL